MAVERSRTFLSRSPDATRGLGEAIGRVIPADTVVALVGDLGGGKTCLVQGLARGLDVRDPVTSPTYALLQTYSGRLELYHFDAWMEGRERAFLVDGGIEWMRAGGVAAVEWADRVLDVLPRPVLRIDLEHASATERRVSLRVEGAGAAAERLQTIVDRIAPQTEMPEIR